MQQIEKKQKIEKKQIIENQRPEPLSVAEIKRKMHQECCPEPLSGGIGSQIELHAQLGSTNDRARELALNGCVHGMAVLAEQQSGGRGRFGRVFHSPAGSGVYLSCVLRPKLPADRAVLLTCMAAVAVARAIEDIAEVQAQIKWVNDVYIDGRKVCGILCEAGMDYENACLRYAVAGIGVNVGRMEFPDELKDIATSISNACGREVSRNAFAAALLGQLNRLYAALEEGDLGFMQEYRSRSNVLGRDVEVLCGSRRYPAKAIAISDDGSLIVEDRQGRQQLLHSGEISLKLK